MQDNSYIYAKNKLNKNVIKLWRVRSLIGLIGLAVAYFVLNSFDFFGLKQVFNWLFGLGVLYTVVYEMIIDPIWDYNVSTYGMGEDAVEIVKGAIFKKRVLIPLVRVQHVNQTQGPVMRMFGLTELSIATASDSFEIEGITVEEATRFSEKVVAAAEAAREDL